jgi:integrase
MSDLTNETQPNQAQTERKMKPKRPRGTGSLYQQKGSSNWWIQYYQNGKSYRESTGTDNRRKAGKILQNTLGEISQGKFIPPSQRRVLVGELVDDLLAWYRTVANKSTFADDAETRWNLHLKPFFGDTRSNQVTTDSLRRYRKARMAEENPPAPATVNRELQVLRKAYKLAARSSPPKVQFVPQFEMAVEDNRRMTFITEEDKQKLRDAASVDIGKKTAVMKGLHLKCFVELLFGFGWREGELIGLSVGDVNLAENFIRLEDSKNGEPREVPLTPNLKVLLEAVVTGRKPDESLFPVKDVRHAWKRLCKSAGVKCGKAEGYVIHDSRRTAARTKRSAGVSETVTCKIMGWKPGSKMFARYGIVDRADMAEALKRSEQWEREQRKSEFEHSSGIVSTGTGAISESRPSAEVN